MIRVADLEQEILTLLKCFLCFLEEAWEAWVAEVLEVYYIYLKDFQGFSFGGDDTFGGGSRGS